MTQIQQRNYEQRVRRANRFGWIGIAIVMPLVIIGSILMLNAGKIDNDNSAKNSVPTTVDQVVLADNK
ncbi:MAG: hypothetical protein WC545_01035 [Patescibacteria group bacterium]|jgi:hypothetical protein